MGVKSLIKSIVKKEDLPFIAAVAAFILAGITARLLFALFVPAEQMFDFAAYHELAVNIKNGLGHTLNGSPVAWQGPLYPYALGLFYMITGSSSEFTGKMLNVVLSSLTLLISVPVYMRLIPERKTCAAAVAVTAFLPVNAAYVNVLGTETLFGFILFALLYCHLRFGGRKAFYPLIGALVGLAALAKPFMVAFPAALTLIYWAQSKSLSETLKYALIVSICAVAVVAPWTIRNYSLFGRFIPVSYNGGYVTYINNNDSNHDGLWMDLTAVGEGDAAVINEIVGRAGPAGLKAASDLEPLLAKRSAGWILSNFGEFLKLGFLRVNETFFSNAHDLAQWAMNGVEYASERDKNALEAAFSLAAKIFSAAGVLFLLSRAVPFFKGLTVKGTANASDAMVFVSMLFFVLTVFLSEGQARYAYPLYPFTTYALVMLISNKLVKIPS